MDLQSFIQSGLLEAYVLGQCTPEERAQVERMAAEHPLVRAELDSIEASLEGYAATHAVQPPDWMKARIMERIDQEVKNQGESTGTESGKSNFALRTFQLLAFALAASTAFFFLQQKEYRSENDQLKIKTDSLQKALIACGEHVQKSEPIVEFLCNPATKRLSIDDGKGLHATVYYNPVQNMMAFDPHGMPPPPSGKYYQFWAIVDGKPVSIDMIQSMSLCDAIHVVSNASAFAISEEDNPKGNPVPTTVVAIAKVG